MRDGWKATRLGDLSSISYGHTDSACADAVGPHFLRITDIQNDQVFWDSVPYCRIEPEQLQKYRLHHGDIVFARTGATTGKSFLITEPPESIFASYLIRLRLLPSGVLPRFLYLYFQSETYWKQIRQGYTGSAQGGFNASKLASLLIPLPRPKEQERIVAILDEAFAAIATAKANAEKNLQNTRALLQTHLEFVFTSRGQGWVERRLEEVCNRITDGTHITPTYVSQGIPFLSVKNLTNGRIDFSDTRFISEEEHRQLTKRVRPEREDILYTKVGTTGVAKVVDVDKEFSIFVSVALLKVKHEVIFNRYLEHFLNAPYARQQAQLRTRGMANKNLVISDINQIKIYFPTSLDEQKLIVGRLNVFVELTQRLESIYRQKLAALDELKQSLLHRAFHGELGHHAPLSRCASSLN